MEFDHMGGFSEESSEDSMNFRESLDKYLKYYRWFILSIILFFTLFYFALRYQVPEYFITASILIKETEKGSSFNDLTQFEGLGLFNSGDNSLENEIQILKSRRLMTKVVTELKLNIRVFREDSPYDIELYPNYPINIEFLTDSSRIDRISTSIEISLNSADDFEVFDYDDQSYGVKKFGERFKMNLGNEYVDDIREIRIEKNNNFSERLIGKSLYVNIEPIKATVNKLGERIIIEPINEKLSKVLTISIQDPVIDKGIALVNNLIEQFNADGINDKNEIAQTTTDFLDLRLGLISAELVAIESTAESFKTKNRMVGENRGSELFLESSTVNEKEIVNNNTQRQLVDYMLSELIASNGKNLLPGNIGLADPGIINLIAEFNALVLQRNRILKSSSEINPIIVSIDSQLTTLKENLESSLKNLNRTLEIQVNNLDLQSSKINSRIASVPKNEREYKDIVREQETKNALYIFLLQKREESILANAANVEKSKVIDPAFSDGSIVSPKKKLLYLISIVLGLMVPVAIIYLKESLDTKVHDESDIKLLKIPFIGDVPLTSTKSEKFIKDGDNSNIAESFRYIRTNIHFMLDKKEFGKVIFVTSTQSGEGKTFTSINLALSLAMSGKKTLLLAMDLRAPKIDKYLGTNFENNRGVTNFIKNEDYSIKHITNKHAKVTNLDIILSGDIPPNPVELLMSRRVDELFEAVSANYEYIIVDTAPVGMVTDTIQIKKYADLSIYVIKANFLDKRMLHIPKKMYAHQKLNNMAILINGTDHSRGAYGYGYGYGQMEKKSFLKRIFSFF